MKCAFSLEHYKHLLQMLDDCGYRAIFYPEYASGSLGSKQVLLRHDIDQSISYAHEMAKTEARAKTKATYFVWLTSPFYNVFAPSQRDLLKEISRMGHDIGLHFDAKTYPNSKCLASEIRSEADILSHVLDTEVKAYSFHRPAPGLIDNSAELPGLINAYEERFRVDFKYISDSNHFWREKCACHHIGVHYKLHILTHSIWWAHRNLRTPIDKLASFKQDAESYIDIELVNNVKAYAQYKDQKSIRQSRR